MDDAVTRLARHLLDGGLAELSDRERRVILLIASVCHAVADTRRDYICEAVQRLILKPCFNISRWTASKRQHVARNVNGVLATKESFGEQLADRVAQLGGSWSFIIVFTGMLVSWVFVNTVVLAGFRGGFDPYPSIFLNLILSMVAALQAPVILMSQNRQAARDRLAASLDYEIDLKAEVEIMSLHDKLDRLRLEHLEGMVREQTAKIGDLSAAIWASLPKPPPGRGGMAASLDGRLDVQAEAPPENRDA